MPTSKNKISHILKFAFLLGMPISAIISLIILDQSIFYNSVIFIVIPVTIIFGWFGLFDWDECNKKRLEQKYSVKL